MAGPRFNQPKPGEMTTSVQKKNRSEEIISTVKLFEPQLSLLLPKHLPAKRMLQIIMTEIRQNPGLAECSTGSIFGSIIQCALLGLEPGKALNLCYLIPLKKQATFRMGFQGCIELAQRHDIAIRSRAVYSTETFKWCEGLNPILEHTNLTEEGEITHAYAIANYLNNRIQIAEVCTRSIIEKARNASELKNGIPWTKYYGEMARKTAVKRLYKYLRKSPEMARALELDNKIDAGEDQNLSAVFDAFKDENNLPQPIIDAVKKDEDEEISFSVIDDELGDNSINI